MTGRLRATALGAALLLASGCGLFGDSGLGTLVAFQKLDGFSFSIQAAELDAGQLPADVFVALRSFVRLRSEAVVIVPPLAEDTRRFAFIERGCNHDSAQLVVVDNVLDVELLEDGSTEQQTYCGGITYFLTVFDVPTGDVPQ